MGLLLNQAYWVAHIQTLVGCRPGQGKTMTAEQTAQYLAILCMAFSDLADDKDLAADIKTAFAVMEAGSNQPPEGIPSFKAFIEVYEQAERAWLMQIGIDLDSAADIIGAIRKTYPSRYDSSEGPERIVSRIKTAARVCCGEQTRNAAEQEKLARAQEMRSVLSGIVTVSVDIAPPLAAAGSGMPLLAIAMGYIASFSVRSGCQAIVDGTKRHF